uniref:Ovule protein n=1 Tax=Heterorhabditis bacteriophora TaxID=37862 RepID=A0A1I7WDW3_HETBA
MLNLNYIQLQTWKYSISLEAYPLEPRTTGNKPHRVQRCTFDCNSLLSDLFCILITDSDSAPSCGPSQYNFLSYMQS